MHCFFKCAGQPLARLGKLARLGSIRKQLLLIFGFGALEAFLHAAQAVQLIAHFLMVRNQFVGGHAIAALKPAYQIQPFLNFFVSNGVKALIFKDVSQFDTRFFRLIICGG